MPPDTLHPRSRHRSGIDFPLLTAAAPGLGRFVRRGPHGAPTIDFADPAAVKALNAAMLAAHYQVERWELPDGFLCPSVPGRADHLHHAADLLAEVNRGPVPEGKAVRVLDVGVGASCVYPLIGRAEYGWRFLGSDVDREALASAGRIVAASPALREAIELRLQRDRRLLLEGLVAEGERFDLTLCNPPFHASAREAAEGSRRKWRNLGRSGEAGRRPTLNFGGREAELWCPGGESAFVGKLIAESAALGTRVLWFTSLVAKSKNLPPLRAALARARVRESRTVEMRQGQKTSRLLAWTFLAPAERERWRAERWPAPKGGVTGRGRPPAGR